MANNGIIINSVIATVWGLETDIISDNKNEARDKWFSEHKVFVLKKDPHDNLAFISLDEFIENTGDESKYWITPTIVSVQKNDNGSYRCYETADGVKYSIYKKGTIEKL